MIIGFTFMIFRLRYSSLCLIIPFRNIFYKML